MKETLNTRNIGGSRDFVGIDVEQSAAHKVQVGWLVGWLVKQRKEKLDKKINKKYKS